ncbi:MAG TPA: hypothetical protein VKN99_25500 [Polyangia bacterium]|nr:hypothetical protein [Polyangia bacterium]
MVLALLGVCLAGCGSGTGRTDGGGGTGGGGHTCGLSACPVGLFCADDPRDSCDPSHGGSNCTGVCVSCAGGGVSCGATTCHPGEWCDSYFSSPPACKCGNRGAACTNGDSCQRAGPVTEDLCGVLCCGVSGPCPL